MTKFAFCRRHLFLRIFLLRYRGRHVDDENRTYDILVVVINVLQEAATADNNSHIIHRSTWVGPADRRRIYRRQKSLINILRQHHQLLVVLDVPRLLRYGVFCEEKEKGVCCSDQ